MGAMTAIMVGLGAASAATQIAGGFAAKNEAQSNASSILSQSNYNASILEQQAGMITEQKNLRMQQHNRAMRFTMGQTVATTAAKGIEFSGSPIAVAVDTMTQMEMDKAIDAYNYDMERYGVMSEADATRRKGATVAAQYRRSGDTAMMSGVVGGLTTLFSTAAYASQSGLDSGKLVKKINTSGKSGYGSRASAYKSLGLI